MSHLRILFSLEVLAISDAASAPITLNQLVSQMKDRRLPSAFRRASPVGQGAIHRDRATGLERFLLVTTIVLLPLQEQIPNVRGFSIIYLMFGVLGVYVLLKRSGSLVRVSTHPVFLAAYVLLSVGFLMESVHTNSDYFELTRYAYMIGGAILVASLCTNRQALQAGFYGYLLASVLLSAFLILTFYGSFQGLTATNLREATSIRGAIFRENPLTANLNTMAFQAAQGVVVALTLALTAVAAWKRYLFLVVALFCLVAAFLPMSRSGIVIALVSCATVIVAYRGKRMRALVVAVVLGIGVLIWVPDLAFTRLSLSMTSSYVENPKADGRASIYAAAFKHLPEYLLTGVGAGNFWEGWGYTRGFGHVGAHNCLIQVTIYWGVMGLLALIAVTWLAYRCLPKQSGSDALSLSLLGIAVSLFLWMLVMHNLYAKEFSLGLGVLVGARAWIWPAGKVQSTLKQRPAHDLRRRRLSRLVGSPVATCFRSSARS
jgi:O-Antigen ligase